VEYIPIKLFKKESNISKKLDLKKTWYLKTAIIVKECMARLNKDIYDGRKYLMPLIEFISLTIFKFFLTEPE